MMDIYVVVAKYNDGSEYLMGEFHDQDWREIFINKDEAQRVFDTASNSANSVNRESLSLHYFKV